MAFGYIVSRILDTYPSLDPDLVERRLATGSHAHIRDRVVYLEIPKAACTAIKLVLRDLYGAAPLRLFPGYSRQTQRRMFVHARENAALPPLTALDDAAQRELLESPDVLRFTVVRNPYTRLVSAWRDKVYLCEPSVEDVYVAVRNSEPDLGPKHPVAFEEFVAYLEHTIGERSDTHWRRQVDLTYAEALSYTHIGRTEELDATTDLVHRHLGREPVRWPRANEGALRPAARYTEELARRVHAIYERDFAVFGYDPASWPREETAPVRCVTAERFVDEVVERNLIIRHLYDERSRLAAAYEDAYRFSLARITRKWRGLFGRAR